jgi:hypothetical protein
MPLPVDIVMGVEESRGLADGVIENLSHALRVVVKGFRNKTTITQHTRWA